MPITNECDGFDGSVWQAFLNFDAVIRRVLIRNQSLEFAWPLVFSSTSCCCFFDNVRLLSTSSAFLSRVG